ncbi:MAG: hypothetical protein GVY33_11985 [Alphaproteobacteria bacterium]|jgi:hypothetical protein|nr:hypothetical protein [Alphaproteobacteria bacterium]
MRENPADSEQDQEDEAAAAAAMAPWIKMLKGFVAVTGVALVLTFALFVYLFIDKRNAERAAEVEREQGPAAPVVAPAGAEIREVRFEGDRALLVLEDADGRAYLMLLDMAAGERISLVVLQE